jgi:hypothetical protein
MTRKLWRSRKRQQLERGAAPVCDASCRLDAHATVARSEAVILTTRVR